MSYSCSYHSAQEVLQLHMSSMSLPHGILGSAGVSYAVYGHHPLNYLSSLAKKKDQSSHAFRD